MIFTSLRDRTPWLIRHMFRRFKRGLRQIMEAGKTPREVFTAIYDQKIWGKPDDDSASAGYYSGPGSDPAVTGPYIELVRKFITTNDIRSVVDIGCGDFRVGRQIINPSVDYTGIDIVEGLITSHQARFGGEKVTFRCLDVITEDPPVADLCLIRQVFQHLSNAHISAILAKLQRYKWVIITEDQPGAAGTFRPNRDKRSGAASRIVSGSGLVLDQPPFNLRNVELLLEVPVPQSEYRETGRISTFLFRQAA